MVTLSAERMRAHVNLTEHNHRVTSDECDEYNCIAWAFGINDAQLWPGIIDMDWPEGVPIAESELESFIALYASIGYEQSEGSDLEDGYEKVAIYGDGEGPTHAALQLASGDWSSKMGMEWEDIAHDTPEAVGGRPGYGRVLQVMRRPRVAQEA